MTYTPEWTEIWAFKTHNLRVVAEVSDCEDDPADSFSFPEDIEMVREGRVQWFDARVRVLGPDDEELGADYLGCCAYAHASDLFRDHSRGTERLRQLRHDHMATFAHMRRLGRSVKCWPGDRAAFLARLAEIRREIAKLKKQLQNTAALEPNVRYCWYGPGMVYAACEDARMRLTALRAVRVRETT